MKKNGEEINLQALDSNDGRVGYKTAIRPLEMNKALGKFLKDREPKKNNGKNRWGNF